LIWNSWSHTGIARAIKRRLWTGRTLDFASHIAQSGVLISHDLSLKANVTGSRHHRTETDIIHSTETPNEEAASLAAFKKYFVEKFENCIFSGSPAPIRHFTRANRRKGSGQN
jgi:hypothetical protein